MPRISLRPREAPKPTHLGGFSERDEFFSRNSLDDITTILRESGDIETSDTETDDKDNSSDTLFISTKYFSNSHETNQEW